MPLDETTIMDYFYLSVFYDKAANNGKTKENLAILKTMKGLEYELSYAQPAFKTFHVTKQLRESKVKTLPIAVYYIQCGKIYQAPSLANVISYRLRQAAFTLEQSLRSLEECTEVNLDKSDGWVRI